MGRLFNNEEFYFSALTVLRFVLASIDRGSVSYVRSRANDVMNHIALLTYGGWHRVADIGRQLL